MNKNKINIIITDDSPDFIEGLRFLLSSQTNYNIIGIYSNGKELVNSKELFLAEVILLDIEMPIMNGIEAAKLISFQYPNLKIIALTMHMDKIYLEEFISVGFKAFIHKPEVTEKLFYVIEKVINDTYVFPENIKITNKNNKL